MDTQAIIKALPEMATQLVAFLVVFWVLKKFAFGSVFKVLDERRDRVKADLAEAEKRRHEMEVLKKEYEQKLQAIEQEARLKVQAAVSDAQRIAAEIREKGQQDAGVLVERAKQEIQRESEKARALMKQQVVELSALMAAKLIGKNLTTAENEKYVLELLSKTGDLS